MKFKELEQNKKLEILKILYQERKLFAKNCNKIFLNENHLKFY